MTSDDLLRGPAMLFCPGDRPDRYDKAVERADVVIFDLEDAVGPEAKGSARNDVVAGLGSHRGKAIVRINAVDSPWFADDVAAMRSAGHRTVMIPKVNRAADLDSVSDLDVIALCETASGVLASPEIANHDACVALMWGSEDLIADLGGRRSRRADGRYHALVEQARSTVRLAATAAGKRAIDTVSVIIADHDAARLDALEAADLGFDAKACIHPDHVALIREAFGVTDAELSWARDVLDEASRTPGVFRLRGQMIDEPLIRHARHIVARAEPGKAPSH